MTGKLKTSGQCADCLNCCKDTVVPITDRDVLRLAAASGLPASEIITLYSTDETDYEPGRRGWIRLKYGKRLMGLRRKNGCCVFLNEDGLCKVYKHRPMTCRTYPFDVELSPNGRLHEVSVMTGVRCKYTNKDMIKTELRRDAGREDREDAAYHKKISKWNNLKPVGKKMKFISFLDMTQG